MSDLNQIMFDFDTGKSKVGWFNVEASALTLNFAQLVSFVSLFILYFKFQTWGHNSSQEGHVEDDKKEWGVESEESR